MGSPLTPVLANIFMGFYESTAFDKETDSLNFLNKRHPNIKFTIEKQINHSIALKNCNSIDVLISGINKQHLTLQTYHKSTYT